MDLYKIPVAIPRPSRICLYWGHSRIADRQSRYNPICLDFRQRTTDNPFLRIWLQQYRRIQIWNWYYLYCCTLPLSVEDILWSIRSSVTIFGSGFSFDLLTKSDWSVDSGYTYVNILRASAMDSVGSSEPHETHNKERVRNNSSKYFFIKVQKNRVEVYQILKISQVCHHKLR